MRILFLFSLFFIGFQQLTAQLLDPEAMDSLMKVDAEQVLIVERDTLQDGTIVFQEIIDGDTIPVVYQPDFHIVSRKFANDAERRAFEKMQRKTIKVYPYARKAIDLMEEIEIETELIRKKRGRKKYKRKLEKELNGRFKEDLVNLTMSEGRILVDLIERETGRTMYSIIKDLKNPVTAFFYQKVGKRFGYNLKDGYNEQEKEDLEIIIKGIEANGEELNEAFDIPD